MKVRITSRHIWSLSLPLVLAGVSETIIDVTDTIFLGRYGVTELGAIGLADAMYEMMVVLAVGLVEGIQIIVARRAGQGKRKEVGSVFNQGLQMLTVISVLLFLVIKFGSPFLTDVVVESEDVRVAVDGFLQVIVFGVLFEAIGLAYGVFYVGISRTRVLFVATAVLAATNVFLDYCLIFGNLGLPRMGIEGAALASVAAEFAAVAFLTLYAWRRGDIREFGLFRFRKWNRRLFWSLVAISSPVALEVFLETARWCVFFAIVERLGESALASANIVYNCYVVLLIPIDGIAEATTSMVSNLIGQGRDRRIGLLLRKALVLCSMVTLPIVAVAAVFPEAALSIFTSDEETVASSSSSLLVIGGALLAAIPGWLLVKTVSGTGDTRATFFIELVLTTVTLTYSYVTALVLEWPLEYVWFSLLIGWCIRIVLSYARLRMQAWKRLLI